MTPSELIDQTVDSQRRLATALASLSDSDMRAASRLPGWTRGHVITKLARSADSHTWMFQGATMNEVRDQFPTAGKREADIEAGAGRPADALRADLTTAWARLVDAWQTLPEDAWDRQARTVAGPRPMHELVFRYLREVEVHHVDLDLGYAIRDWPSVYVEGEMERRLRTLPDRADHAELVLWLLDRGPVPTLSPW